MAANLKKLRSEEGFSLVEVLIAALILTVGMVGSLGALDAATKSTFSAQRHEQSIALAQREMEKLTAVSFARLELDTAPAAIADASNNPEDPRAYVSGANFQILASYHDRAAGAPTGSPGSEPLVIDPDVDPAADGVSIPAMTQGVTVGGGGAQQTATVYRFVTRRDESCDVLGPIDLCPAEQGSKRLTVAVRMNAVGNGAGSSKPVYVSSVVTDPDAAALDLPL